MAAKFWRRRKKAPEDDLVNPDPNRMPQHIAIIMDGNGRWARKRGLPRTFGHKAGAEVLREISAEAANLGIRYLTAYAFSTENWRRPDEEVSFLMNLFASYLDAETENLVNKQVKLRFIGNTDRLNPELRRRMEEVEKTTAQGTSLTLNLALDYGGPAEIVQAASRLAQEVVNGNIALDKVDEQVFSQFLFTSGQPDPDLLIRPGGDLRISNFLLWQLAYAELWVTDVLWPDFSPMEFRRAIRDYQARERRFGGLQTLNRGE